MPVLLFLAIIVMLLCYVSIRQKLCRIEDMLKKLSETTDKPAVICPSIPEEPAEMSVVEAEKVTENPSFEDDLPPKESVLKSFWRWFCVGSIREGVSVEYAAATTWLMRAGVIVLLCGIGFFLKYSIEKNLISPTVRIILTFLSGAGMFLAGTYGIRKKFHTLAIGILAAGVVTLYMGSFAGYKLYHVMPAAAAFILMLLTTAAAMLTAVKKNLLPVALTGCTGAYLTPVMLSDGSGNLPFLVGYTAMISAGLLLAARVYRWRSLEITSFFFSFIIIFAGAVSLPSKVNAWCILFLFINFLVFTLIPVLRKKEYPFGLTEWLLPVGAAAFALWNGIGMICSCVPGSDEKLYSAGFALLVSAVTLAEGIWLARKREGGFKLLPAFLSAAFFSLALAVPLALQDEASSAAAWSVLALVLVFSFIRSRQKTLLVLSFFAFFGASIAGLEPMCTGESMERFFSFGMLAITLIGSGVLLHRNPVSALSETFKKVYFICGGSAFLWYSSLEVYKNLRTSLYGFRHGGLSVWWGLCAASMLISGIGKNIRQLRTAGLLLFAVCLAKVYAVDISGLNTLYKVIAFLLLGVLLLGGAAAYIFYRKRFGGEG